MLFSQTGGSTSDPDVEFDGYTRFYGTTEITDSTNSTLSVSPNWDVNPASGDGYEVSNEFVHVFEMGKQMNDEKWTDENNGYPTTGVGTANDKIIRRGTFAVDKGT